MWSRKIWEEFDSLYCLILAVWSWQVGLADFIGLFSNLRGRARKGNVRRLGVYVISSPRLVFRAPFPFCSYAMRMTSVFTPIKWVKYVKSSF